MLRPSADDQHMLCTFGHRDVQIKHRSGHCLRLWLLCLTGHQHASCLHLQSSTCVVGLHVASGAFDQHAVAGSGALASVCSIPVHAGHSASLIVHLRSAAYCSASQCRSNCLKYRAQCSVWPACRYPAAVVRDLPQDRPKALTILGKRMVLWCDSSQDWHAFEDKCPHRGVALSEGRLEGGDLQCSYHGWQFKGVWEVASVLDTNWQQLHSAHTDDFVKEIWTHSEHVQDQDNAQRSHSCLRLQRRKQRHASHRAAVPLALQLQKRTACCGSG